MGLKPSTKNLILQYRDLNVHKHLGGIVGGSFRLGSLSRCASVALAALTLLASISSTTFAAIGDGGSGTTAFTTTYFEHGNLIRAGETVQALGPDLMGDSINEYSGSLEFTQNDVSLPGNNALAVAVGRHLSVGSRQTALVGGLFGDWDLEIPHLRTLAADLLNGQPADWYGGYVESSGTFNLNRCSQFVKASAAWGAVVGQSVSVHPNNWWDGYRMHIPGSGVQTLLKRGPANTAQPSSGGPYPIVTKAHWQISCLASLASGGAGEGFLALAPDGTSYRFDRKVSRPYVSYRPPGEGPLLSVPRTEVWILPSQITDRFGNWIQYTYDAADAWKVLSIASSDGRVITFTYVTGTRRVQTVWDGTRTWSYGYSASGALQSVTLPDQSSWQFSLASLTRDPYYVIDPTCYGGVNSTITSGVTDQNSYVGTIVHPSGATASFTLKMTWHGRSNVPGSIAGCEDPAQINYVPTLFANYSLTSKTLSGPGLPAMTWQYDYGTANGSFAPCNGCVSTKAVTVTDPLGNVTRDTYGTLFGVNEGLLVSSDEGWNGGTALRTTGLTYQASNAGPYPALIGTSQAISDAMSAIHTPQSARVITQQAATFAQSVLGFDIFARATSLTRSSSLGYSRSESTAYYDHASLWVLGQTASQTIAGTVAASTSFDPATALPSSTSRFGKLQAGYVFNADGTLFSVKDGLNQTTTFTNYVRGLPQNIGYADGTGISAVVNNIGTLNSVTNEFGTTWTFTYDTMGRLSGKIPPAGDPVAYNPTTYSFVQVPSAEYGLEANHWRQSIAQGNAVTVNYFDARWRKRLTITYDAADPGTTQRMQRFDYDPYNRTTFAAYPARSIASATSSTPGTTTNYDALGRATQTLADSELGTLTTNTQYLAGFQKQVTNPRGVATTTSYQVFDEPSESAITGIVAPEGVSVSIGRDVFGKPQSITRGGPSVASGPASVTRNYVYDANQLLCKIIEPEIGATVQLLDAANNVAWRATGLGLTSASSCDTSSVPGASKVSYTYDARNRLLGTSFADGSPAIGRTYTADGLPATVTSNNSTWSYTYNNRRLLTQESLAYGSTYNIGWSYDANAHVSQLGYPDGATVAYSPNALGEATQVSGYASGIAYQPNGAVAGYTLANGTVHSQSQNVRGLPLVNSDAGVLQDQYSYDANGNVSAIADQQAGVSSRSMGYDGLDRLTAANSPGVWGSANYSYDGLDNLRTSVVGSRSSVHAYDAGNRLSTINTNGSYTGYVYDAQGNITGRGNQGFFFDQGNRMTLANGLASYTYDGLGRRTSISGNDGSYRLQVYSQGGQLLYGTLQQGTSVSTRYAYLGGKLIAETNSATGATTYVHTDALGSPVATVGTTFATVSYSCPSGWTLSGNTCTQVTNNTVAATLAGYNCPSGYTLSGSTCSLTTVTTSTATVSYSCPSGWSLSGTNCISSTSSAATPVYACPSGYTLSGSSCSRTATAAATANFNCNGHGSLAAYAGSPSGYKCIAQNVLLKQYPDPYGRCQEIAASMGLPLVATPTISGGLQCVMGPLVTYSCPAGASLSGTTCTSTVTQAATVSSYTCSSGTVSGSSCVTTSTSAAGVSYSCPAGQTLSGSSCSQSSTATTAGTPYYSCPAGYTLSGTTCSVQGTASTAATVVLSCPSGGTLSGLNCEGVVTRTSYEAYGNTAAGATPRDIGFTGHVNDADTGLVYMQQRYYDPIAGRFQSVDPVTTDANSGQSFNRYEYANSNPYRYTDPDGRCVEDFCIGEAIVVGRFVWGAYRAYRAAEQVAKAVEVIQAVGNKGGDATPAPSPAAGAPEAAPAPPGTQGCIYCVKGENTSSGKDYIGSTDNMGNRQRDTSDGRNREGADIVGTYPKGDRDARRTKEQQAINDRGGVDKLDNKRNEVAPKNWPDKKIEPPKESPKQ